MASLVARIRRQSANTQPIRFQSLAGIIDPDTDLIDRRAATISRHAERLRSRTGTSDHQAGYSYQSAQ